MYTVAVLLALATSACAYTVTKPSGAQGWTNVGPQPASWNRVSTDPLNFSIILTNQDRAVLPQDQILVAQQDGVSTDTVNCNPPSGGWPLGKSFRINLVKSTEDQSTIYAQSDEFDIKAPNATSSTSLAITTPTTPIAAPPVTTSSSSSSTTGNNAPPNPNGSAILKASSGLMAVLGAVTLFAA
ncbi:hypothetical protein AN958_05477 [Leucoagaricus sp. SymC.cos]|nr:hypothetical protein AN958_05477 [Leucoagaricus sp. SymC.cos]